MSASTWTYTVPPYIGRQLDPIRAAALEAAVEHLHAYDFDEGVNTAEEVVKAAKTFEAYLAGEKATDG